MFYLVQPEPAGGAALGLWWQARREAELQGMARL
jgi:hypothetical protein